MSYSKYARKNPVGFTVSHREYICDVVAANSGPFAYAAYYLNPGLESTFPWLSQIAPCFEQYQLKRCSVHYISTSADVLNSTNTALGSVILACDYNAGNAPFTTKQQMENSCLSISGKPSQDIMMPIDVRKSHGAPLQAHFVRSGAAPANQDIRFFDVGLFQIATVGGQQTGGKALMQDPYSGNSVQGTTIGELWIEYTVSFFKPILDNDVSNKLSVFHWVNINTPANDINNALVLGGATSANASVQSYNTLSTIYPGPSSGSTNAAYIVHDDFGIFLQSNGTNNVIMFPAGSASGVLKISMHNLDNSGEGGTIGFLAATVGSYMPRSVVASATAGIALIKGLFTGQSWSIAQSVLLANSTSLILTQEIFVNITNSNLDNYVVVSGTGSFPAASTMDLQIIQMAPSPYYVGGV